MAQPTTTDVHVDGLLNLGSDKKLDGDKMPLQRCGADGQGWKWGNSGKCYTGADAKRRAIAQGVAVEGFAKVQKYLEDLEDFKLEKAAMSGKTRNDLPDSAFAYIEPGGKKDDSGKTTPRSLRHFPIHDAAHVRNALARLSQSSFGDKARAKVLAAAKKFGIRVSTSKGDPMFVHLTQFLSTMELGLKKLTATETNGSEQIDQTKNGDLAKSKQTQNNDKVDDTLTPASPEDIEKNGVSGEVEQVFKVVNSTNVMKDGLVTGIIYEPFVKDAHGDWATPETIRKAIHGFMSSAVINNEHSDDFDPSQVRMVELYTAPADFTIEETGEVVRKGSGLMVVQIDDIEIRKAIVAGEFSGFSLEGTGVRVGR